jgi:hypothetical protein
MWFNPEVELARVGQIRSSQIWIDVLAAIKFEIHFLPVLGLLRRNFRARWILLLGPRKQKRPIRSDRIYST